MVDGAGRDAVLIPSPPLGQARDDLALEQDDEDDDGDRHDDGGRGDRPVGSSKYDAPVKNASAAGTGRAALVDVSEMP